MQCLLFYTFYVFKLARILYSYTTVCVETLGAWSSAAAAYQLTEIVRFQSIPHIPRAPRELDITRESVSDLELQLLRLYTRCLTIHAAIETQYPLSILALYIGI